MDREQELEARVDELETRLAAMQSFGRRRSVRRRSELTILGLPLYDIATGPDFASGELRGRACGVIAVGDIATGVLAFGGVARGLIAFGGVAIGGIALGGLAVGLGLAIGGAAIGTIALGGGAVGFIAVGGGAAGYYAVGGGAIGEHVIDGMQQDPAAVAFFEKLGAFAMQLMGR